MEKYCVIFFSIIMKKTFAIGLIIIGSFLEIWFYIIRFQRDGFDFWIAAVMGGFLTLLLSVLVLLKNGKKWWILVGIFFLICGTDPFTDDRYDFFALQAALVNKRIDYVCKVHRIPIPLFSK